MHKVFDGGWNLAKVEDEEGETTAYDLLPEAVDAFVLAVSKGTQKEGRAIKFYLWVLDCDGELNWERQLIANLSNFGWVRWEGFTLLSSYKEGV